MTGELEALRATVEQLRREVDAIKRVTTTTGGVGRGRAPWPTLASLTILMLFWSGLVPTVATSTSVQQVPFTVVDSAGKPLFQVLDKPVRGVLVHGWSNQAILGELSGQNGQLGLAFGHLGQKAVAEFGIHGSGIPGGFMRTNTPDGKNAVLLVSGGAGGLVQVSGSSVGARLTTNVAGGGTLEFLDSGGNATLVMGAGRNGGEFEVRDPAAIAVVQAYAENGVGHVKTGPGAYARFYPFPISELSGKR